MSRRHRPTCALISRHFVFIHNRRYVNVSRLVRRNVPSRYAVWNVQVDFRVQNTLFQRSADCGVRQLHETVTRIMCDSDLPIAWWYCVKKRDNLGWRHTLEHFGQRLGTSENEHAGTLPRDDSGRQENRRWQRQEIPFYVRAACGSGGGNIWVRLAISISSTLLFFYVPIL